MKKIGFIDYYISEWHANNYPSWIKNYCKKVGLDYEVAYAWAEKDVSLVDGLTYKVSHSTSQFLYFNNFTSVFNIIKKAHFFALRI